MPCRNVVWLLCKAKCPRVMEMAMELGSRREINVPVNGNVPPFRNCKAILPAFRMQTFGLCVRAIYQNAPEYQKRCTVHEEKQRDTYILD